MLARAGERLGEIDAPALVVWGADDRYLPTRFAHAYGEVLGGEVEVVDGAGHWPWIDKPELIDRVCAFLEVDRVSALAPVLAAAAGRRRST